MQVLADDARLEAFTRRSIRIGGDGAASTTAVIGMMLGFGGKPPARLMRRYPRDPRSMVVMRRLMLVVAVPFFLVDGFAIYRRIVMLRRLDVRVADAQLRAGSAVVLEASSWATTMMTVRLELVQGARSETLLLHRLPPNKEATLDPRPRNARVRVVLTADQLSHYAAGDGVLRATATWRAQLLRTSRPVVREAAVRIIPGGQSPSSGSSRRGGAYVAARPLAVHEPPRAPARILVAQ